ncbi:MAG: DNA protecting protein DprA [Acidobacteria bacterium RIFCSPLOWO2_02_FULL_65_29]|nr:MAG: DNA protecting protein DprA [Acidobacteria bacterium RIFCSPLOWO2_02_FULL_65_29]
MPSTADYAALSLLPPAWRIDTVDQLRRGRDPCDVLESLLGTRRLGPGMTRASIQSLAALAIARGASRGLTPLVWTDAAYPPMLAAIVDPPPMVWLRGCVEALERQAVAIVGSRAGSPYALAVAERLAADLAERGIAIVSGLARGVDSAAHRGALGAGGTTIGVLGSGADVVYPSEHKTLAQEMTARGAVLSELVPGTRPLPMFFPMRNRIISGLSRAVVVVEAGEKSGSLITARAALDQGRDVLAVPGNVLSGRNRGSHALLRDGATIVETAEDILEELGLSPAPSSHRVGASAADPVLACLTPGESSDVDTIAEQSGLSIARLLPRLFDLEVKGLVRRAGGGRFIRI